MCESGNNLEQQLPGRQQRVPSEPFNTPSTDKPDSRTVLAQILGLREREMGLSAAYLTPELPTE